MGILLGVPAVVNELHQKGLLERAYHDGLVPNLAFRAEAMPEEWPANTGQQLFMTRAGLITPVTTPITPGQDPPLVSVPFEQWVATLSQFGTAIDTDMPSSTIANGNLFLRNLHQLGVQAGMSVNRLARNSLFQAYLSGQTTLLTAASTGDVTLRVASCNGFLDVVVPGGNVAPQIVSSAFPLPATLGASTKVSIIGVTPDNTADPNGQGTLQLAAALGAGAAIRTSLVSAYAPIIMRSAPGNSVDAITAGDTITLQQCINAVAILRQANVPPHDDGYYHAHISPTSNAQLFADPVFQRLNQSLPNGVAYSEGFVGYTNGIMFFMNNEAPTSTNTGLQIGTGGAGVYATDLGAEIVNSGGVSIGRVIITGKGAMYERYLDESAFVTEAGTTGKIGEFDVTNNGLHIMTERIRLVIRSPQDRLQQKVGAAWSVSTSFPVPSDITAPSGPQRYKRAIVLEHAA